MTGPSPELSPGLRSAWSIAEAEARRGRSAFIEPVHLFIGVCKLGNLVELKDWSGASAQQGRDYLAEAARVVAIFEAASCDRRELYRGVRRATAPGNVTHESGKPVSRSEESRTAFAHAVQVAGLRNQVDSTDLLAALMLPETSELANILSRVGCDPNRLRVAAAKAGLTKRVGAADSTLARYGRDLTDLAMKGAIRECVGRRRELLQLVRTLSRVTKNNPILVGEPGVGKTAIVEGLAWRIAKGKSLPGNRVVELSVGDLVAGATYRGEFEERLQTILRDASMHPEVIVFIDEIHTLVRAGAVEHGALDAANILKPALARGELRCIGATTIAEYELYFAKDAAFERRFQLITVNEPSLDEAVAMLRAGYVERFEAEYGVHIVQDALLAAVHLSQDYLPNRRLPDKAIDLLDEACAMVVVPTLTTDTGHERSASVASVTSKTVAAVISEWTGIPAQELIV